VTKLVEELYLPRTLEARKRLLEAAGDPLVDPAMDPVELELFLIRFSSMGVRMTEPVESWIRRAGERCSEIGLARLGRALQIHANQEADHHLMMIDDTRALVASFNARHAQRLDAEELLSSRPTAATETYVKLHEDVIRGPAPYCQIAIEFEIENLSVTLGPRLMQQCQRLLGPEVLQGLSFVREHIAVDAGHTLFNMAELERVLAGDPGRAELLAETGSAALDAYGGFLAECLVWSCRRNSGFFATREPAKAAS
jgi:hypothetical protein